MPVVSTLTESNRDGRYRSRSSRRGTGLAQLSVVEHALCPLDDRLSLVKPLAFDTGYFRTNKDGERVFVPVQVVAQEGLSATDELYLWGLLALTFAEKEPSLDLWATPHWCLKQLGFLDQSKGGANYSQFRAVLRRLAGTTYFCDRFYDPNSGEERQRAFGFLKYDLPLRDTSLRSWRIVWDPLFFEYCQARGGRMGFDLQMYRQLDCASRRLFLLLTKIFARRDTSPHFDLWHLGTNVLGFSDSLEIRYLKAKLTRCITRLLDADVVRLPDGIARPQDLFEKKRVGAYALRLHRGPYFDNRERKQTIGAGNAAVQDSPLYDPLVAIGFDSAMACRILGKYPPKTVQLWSDITLAAMENPRGFPGFKKSPQAFLLDNVKNAADGVRTPPDWWHDLTRRERRSAEQATRIDFEQYRVTWQDARQAAFKRFVDEEVGRQRYEQSVKTLQQMYAHTLPEHVALQDAIQEAERHFERQFEFPDLPTWVLRNAVAIQQDDGRNSKCD